MRIVFGFLVLAIVGMSAMGQDLMFPVKDTGGVQFLSDRYGAGRSSTMGGGEGRFHNGIDIACRVGTPVVAVANGIIIVCAAGDRFLGNYMTLRLADGRDCTYGHLKETWYAKGKWVLAGTVIGLSGNTGQSTGPHLHFQVTRDPYRDFKSPRILSNSRPSK